MSSSASIIYPFTAFRKMATHRKAWLRLNHIDYVNGRSSARTYRISDLIVKMVCVLYWDLWVFIFLLIIGAIFFF